MQPPKGARGGPPADPSPPIPDAPIPDVPVLFSLSPELRNPPRDTPGDPPGSRPLRASGACEFLRCQLSHIATCNIASTAARDASYASLAHRTSQEQTASGSRAPRGRVLDGDVGPRLDGCQRMQCGDLSPELKGRRCSRHPASRDLFGAACARTRAYWRARVRARTGMRVHVRLPAHSHGNGKERKMTSG